MTKKNFTRSANLTLGGIALGFIISYPFHASFLGGLISSGCTAGMIGGLADWFAVTALFRRPLGIRPNKVLRTEIIPQNRERIFAALTDMVQNELLSQDVLRKQLAVLDFSGMFLKIMADENVQGTVNNLLAKLSEESSAYLESKEYKSAVVSLAQANLSSLNLPQTLAKVLEFSLEHGEIDQVIKALCGVIEEYLDEYEVNTALNNMMEAALFRYGENNPTRKLVEMFLPSPSVLAHGLLDKAKTALEDGTVQGWLKAFVIRFLGELKTDPNLQERINKLLLEIINKQLAASRGSDELIFLRTSTQQSLVLIRKLLGNFTDHWADYTAMLEENSALRRKMDEQVKIILEKQILVNHDMVGRLVREGLEPLTNDKLVELIEDKAGNDLQMIRINGSVVGGLAGMALYVLGMVLR